MHDRVDRRTHDVHPGVPPNSLQPRTRPQWLGLCIDVGYVINTNLLWESGEALLEVFGDNLLDCVRCILLVSKDRTGIEG
jgi:hypothetical protein